MALTWRLLRLPKLPAAKRDSIQAAGGAVWRRADDHLEVLVVHRPRYDDWTLPKGKLAHDEDHATAALREVEEETGLRCALGAELPTASYRNRHGRPKVVRYWAMTPMGGRFAPSNEVDRVRWIRVADAARILTYDRDRVVVDALSSTL